MYMFIHVFSLLLASYAASAPADASKPSPPPGAESPSPMPDPAANTCREICEPCPRGQICPAECRPMLVCDKAPTPRPKPPTKARYKRLSPDEITRFVTPHVDPRDTVMHAPFRGPLGPSADTIVVITQKPNEDLGGFVLFPANGGIQKVELPTLQEAWPGYQVDALAFVPECDGDVAAELVVISKHRTARWPATVATAIDFDGGVFRRMEELDYPLIQARTVDDVRRILRKRHARALDTPPVKPSP